MSPFKEQRACDFLLLANTEISGEAQSRFPEKHTETAVILFILNVTISRSLVESHV